jgi:hypothetical protein
VPQAPINRSTLSPGPSPARGRLSRTTPRGRTRKAIRRPPPPANSRPEQVWRP